MASLWRNYYEGWIDADEGPIDTLGKVAKRQKTKFRLATYALTIRRASCGFVNRRGLTVPTDTTDELVPDRGLQSPTRRCAVNLAAGPRCGPGGSTTTKNGRARLAAARPKSTGESIEVRAALNKFREACVHRAITERAAKAKSSKDSAPQRQSAA